MRVREAPRLLRFALVGGLLLGALAAGCIGGAPLEELAAPDDGEPRRDEARSAFVITATSAFAYHVASSRITVAASPTQDLQWVNVSLAYLSAVPGAGWELCLLLTVDDADVVGESCGAPPGPISHRVARHGMYGPSIRPALTSGPVRADIEVISAWTT